MASSVIQITGNALRGFQKAANESRAIVQKAVNAVAYKTQLRARENVTRLFKHEPPPPGERVRSSLRPSITVVPMRTSLSAKVGANIIYAHYREYGGTIRPVHKKWLSWWTTEAPKGIATSLKTRRTVFNMRSKKNINANIGWAAHRVFAKKVTQRARPFLGPALQQAQREHPEIPVVANWIKELYKEPGA